MTSPIDSFRSFFSMPWSAYKTYLQRIMADDSVNDTKVMEYWRNRLFISTMTVALPLALITVVLSMIIEYRSGYSSIIKLDMVVFCILSFLVLTPGLSLDLRKLAVGALIAIFAVLLLGVMGSFNMGCIYLFALSIFIVLQYSGKVAFAGVMVNLLICACFTVIIKYQLFSLPIISMIRQDHWVLYSLNFLFLDFVLVALIQQLLSGLEQTITKKSSLYKRLKEEMILKDDGHRLLTQSEEHYKTLFSQSPLSICVYDKESLRFLQVNEAATRTYKYAEDEFLQMNLTAIQSQAEVTDIQGTLVDQATIGALSDQEIALHVKKDGELIHVEIKSSDFTFQGKQARLIIATDFTQKVNDMIAIKQQNEKLKQIAFMQSHVVRVPLANIMGLSNLIMEEVTSDTQRDLFNYLNVSVKQLDDVIRDIVNLKNE